MSNHLDLDTLADVLAGETESAHLEECESCRAALAELETALTEVASVLAALPDPELPAGLAERLDAAVARERRALTAPAVAATVTPLAGRRTSRARFLPVAGGLAAAAVLVVGGIFLVDNTGGSSKSTTATRAQDSSIARNSTGSAYRKDGKLLAAELPALLKGEAAGLTPAEGAAPLAPSSQADRSATKSAPLALSEAAPLAALHTTAGLASCLSALSDPSDPGIPLALDYAAFDGQPALVVVLPSATADKVDVFVVGAGCTASDAKLLFFTRLAKPS